ncbi:DISARM system phospholipase D-like protein DrmC [Tundrisphaera sp. TA3]|uniref:DISARM system phospholipase D-like protein DrmC n=1 Tax=Tundrisphaera sp. TA3 TaxID=3435775 RepID=UPI003EBAA0B2
MSGGLGAIEAAANRLSAQLPTPLLRSLAEAIMTCEAGQWTMILARTAGVVPHALYRTLGLAFIRAWREEAAGLGPEAVALALMTAAHFQESHRDGQSVELVWTGPESGTAPFRRTEQAILQVIDAATRRLLIASYAVYNIPRICEALVRAAGRGVMLTVVVEACERQAGREAYDSLRALGPAVASRSDVYLWPHERRPRDQNGRSGLLHVKCVAGDGRWLFVSSANLTEYAFTTNMELGVLITGGGQPARIEAHFEGLIESGVLERA